MTSFNKPLFNRKCVMHLYLQHPMRLCRWAGFFPIDDLNQPNFGKLRFRLCAPYILYYAATITGQLMLTGFSLYQLTTRQLTLATLSSFVFYGTGMTSAILFMRLAGRYADFLKEAVRIERFLTKVMIKKSAYKSNVVAFVVIGLAAVENILSVVFVMNLVMNCVNDFTFSAEVFKNYFKFRMPYIYEHISYNVWIAILLEVANLQATFLWNFADVFIMCFSMYLTSYCRSLSDLVRHMINKNNGSWENVRNQYCHLMTLVRLVNTNLRYFVFLSFFIDLYFICLQLFNTLNQGYSGFHRCSQYGLDKALNGAAHTAYYSFSFLFLILRAMITSLLASNVYAAAREPIFTLRSVTSSVYNVEIQRILHQMTHTKLALSGLFFHVTRNMILKVAATIVTYELVLLQFSRGHGKHSSNNENSTIFAHDP